MQTVNLDRMFYLVIRDHQDGALVQERMLSDMSRETTIDDIATGQFGDVLKVIEWNAAENTSRDVTEDILREAGKLDDDYEPRLTGQNAIEAGWDHARGLRSVA